MALETLYREILLDHNRNPRNRGAPSGWTHQARGQDALCGDDIRVYLRIDGDGRVAAAGFEGDACAVTTAAASMLTEWLTNRPAAEIGPGLTRFRQVLANPGQAPEPELGALDQLRAVARFPSRVRNALLPWTTALKALEQGERIRRPSTA